MKNEWACCLGDLLWNSRRVLRAGSPSLRTGTWNGDLQPVEDSHQRGGRRSLRQFHHHQSKLGPFKVPVHVFLTALGSARGTGGRSSLRTQIQFSDVTHASNSDEYENPDDGLLEATANFDFILSANQTTTAVIRAFGKPADITSFKLRLFYKGMAVSCSKPTVC